MDKNMGTILQMEFFLIIPDASWCWNIYLQNWVIFGVNVGKYSIHGASGYYLWEHIL
jgi:hypothetical protein